jgi:hypothetical protein
VELTDHLDIDVLVIVPEREFLDHFCLREAEEQLSCFLKSL